MLIIRRLNYIDSASGIVLSVSGRPVHRLREDYSAILSQPEREREREKERELK